MYTFVPYAKLEASHALACRAMYDISLQLVKDRFTGALDATNAKSEYSVLPRYKYLVPQLSKVLVPDMARKCALREYTRHENQT